jgi:hypothetical protein
MRPQRQNLSLFQEGKPLGAGKEILEKHILEIFSVM